MKLDYEALEQLNIKLNKTFSNINKNFSDITSSLETITSLNNWDSETRDYFMTFYNEIQNNFNIISDKFSNIYQYLDSVVNNYRLTEQQLKIF